MNRQKAGAEKQPLAGKNQTPGTLRPFKRHASGAVDAAFTAFVCIIAVFAVFWGGLIGRFIVRRTAKPATH